MTEQNWKGIDGATAWHLIDRHGEGSEGIAKMMNEWRTANSPDLTAIVRSSIVAYNEGRAGSPYHPGYTEHERIAWEAGHSAGGWGGKH